MKIFVYHINANQKILTRKEAFNNWLLNKVSMATDKTTWSSLHRDLTMTIAMSTAFQQQRSMLIPWHSTNSWISSQQCGDWLISLDLSHHRGSATLSSRERKYFRSRLPSMPVLTWLDFSILHQHDGIPHNINSVVNDADSTPNTLYWDSTHNPTVIAVGC